MGKNPNTFQKRVREMEKKRKAEDKRKRKQASKAAAANPTPLAPRTDQQPDSEH